jgi:hypothetical protein
MICVTMLFACGTIGGAMQGAAQDLNSAGTYVKSIGKKGEN